MHGSAPASALASSHSGVTATTPYAGAAKNFCPAARSTTRWVFWRVMWIVYLPPRCLTISFTVALAASSMPDADTLAWPHAPSINNLVQVLLAERGS